MNNLKYFFIFIIAIGLWYFLYGFDDPKPQKSIDNGHVSEPIILNTRKDEAKQKVVKPVDEVPTYSIKPNLISESEPQISYLQAYRNTVFFNKCFDVVKDINKSISPLIFFNEMASLDINALSEDLSLIHI